MKSVIAALLLAALGALADDAKPAPAATLQLLVMLKVVTYDQQFASRPSGDFVVHVPYEAAHKDEVEALVKECLAMPTHTINDRKLQFAAIPIDELDKQPNASAVLLSKSLSAPALKKALEVARAKKMYSFALDESQVKAGAMFGVSVATGRPQPLLNPTTAKAQGVELSAAVLKVIKMVQ